MTKTPTGPDQVDNSCEDRPLLNPAATAARLGITQRALADLRRRGAGPRYIRISSATIRYLSDDLSRRIY
jgi:hypothetical protein